VKPLVVAVDGPGTGRPQRTQPTALASPRPRRPAGRRADAARLHEEQGGPTL